MKSFLIFLMLLMGLFSPHDKLFASKLANRLLANKLDLLKKPKTNKQAPIKKPKNPLDHLIIVSCSGKSGSTALEKSFKALGFETYRYHRIPKDVYPYILDRAKDTNILLVDSIRDVIAKKVSAYFCRIDSQLNLSREQIVSRYKKNRIAFLNYVQKDFDKKIIKAVRYGFNNWNKLGYECLKDGVFDFKKKYQFKKIGNLYFVNLRFDDIKNWEQIIQSIDLPMDLSNFKIVEANMAKDKWYNEIYKDFLEYFTISRATFDKILDNSSEALAHFYTDQEIEDFINKWKPHIRD